MEIKEAAENYLETIYIIKKKQEFCRAIDVCKELNYSKPTVSVVMHNFRENGYIEIDENGHISLTETGLSVAEKMYERHQIIAKVLISLGVDEETAFKDSCKIEHDVSKESFEHIKDHYLKNI